mgnify:CR=1 FL=1
MAFKCNDRVKETTTTTGTGTVTLAGAVTHFESFNSGIGNGSVTYYCIVHEDTAYDEWEVGVGTYTHSGTTLTRSAISSSNSDSEVSFTAGTKSVFITMPASKGVLKDNSGAFVTGDGSATGFMTELSDDTTPQLGGDLDVDGNAIISASDGDIAINANGTGMVTMTANSVTGDVVPGKLEGTNFTDSLLVGHSTTGTLDAATKNTGVGIDAMDAITSGDNNVCVGYIAGTALTEGSNNVLIGRTAGTALTTSTNNTALGTTALATLTTDAAGRNTAIGQNSLNLCTGGRNTALGYDSGSAVSTGIYNICIGGDGGDNITEGSGNVIIGSVDAASATGDRQLMITGYDGSTTTTWIEGDSSGNVVFAGTATAAGSLLATQGDATALAVALG